DHVSDPLKPKNVEPKCGHSCWILSRATKHTPEARIYYGAEQQIDREQSEKSEIVECAIVLQDRETKERAAQPDGEAVIAAVRRKSSGNKIRHLPEGQRDHNEIDAPGAQTHVSGQVSKNCARQKRCWKRHKHVRNAVRAQNSDGVGSTADKGRMSERDQPAIATDKIERECGDCKDHHAGKKTEHIAFRTKSRGERNQCKQQENGCRQSANTIALR